MVADDAILIQQTGSYTPDQFRGPVAGGASSSRSNGLVIYDRFGKQLPTDEQSLAKYIYAGSGELMAMYKKKWIVELFLQTKNHMFFAISVIIITPVMLIARTAGLVIFVTSLTTLLAFALTLFFTHRVHPLTGWVCTCCGGAKHCLWPSIVRFAKYGFSTLHMNAPRTGFLLLSINPSETS
ncbi:hypothetical protein OROMI_011211 [Orobanche minor]